MRMITLVFISWCCLFSCTGIPNKKVKNDQHIDKHLALDSLLNDDLFGEPIELISVEEIYQLLPEQKKEFLNVFNNRNNQDTSPHKRIYSFLEKRLDLFNYYSDTNTASESLAENKGNCLSLAILTKALAKLGNVDIAYQLVETEPVYQKEGNIVVSSQHIRTVLFEDRKKIPGRITISLSRLIIDYFPTFNSRILRSVSEAEFHSMYYTNMATEAIMQDNDRVAYWNLKKALELMPGDANAINIMAVLYERAGYYEQAEDIYLFGLNYAGSEEKQLQQNLDILNNYYFLLKRQDRNAEATVIAERIAKFKDPNPFKWISLGNTAYNNRDYKKAISYFKKATKLAPYIHESYAGISRSEYQLGNLKASEKSLEKAIKNSQDNIHDIYKMKLDMLKQLFNKKRPLRIHNESE